MKHIRLNIFLIVLFNVVLTKGIFSQHAMPYHPHKGCGKGCGKGLTYSHPKNLQTSLLHNYDVKFYHLNISVERHSIDIEGNVIIMAEVLAAHLDTFAFELVPDLLIDSVLIDGTKSDFHRVGDDVFVEVIPLKQAGDFITATIFYGGTPPSSGFFSGITTNASPNWGNQVTWTLSEPFNAKQWFPVKQVLSDKADSVYVFVTTDLSNKVGSNGILTGIDTIFGNKHTFKWKSRYPIAYYLISIAVGEYVDYSFYAHPSNSNDSILIQNYIYNNPATLPHFKQQIDLTKDFIELFSELFGLYPFSQEKYGHCMAPLSGGMEHQTMSTQGFFSFTLTSHELGHQWFGNSVTCGTWSDIWINEGFASYSEYLALEFLNTGNEGQWISDVHSIIKTSPGGSVYVPPADANNVMRIFDSRLSYKKGAAIVHMIRYELQNDSIFFDVLQTFLNIFRDSVATGEDFKEVLNSVSGKNFDEFFTQWYYGEGYPLFDIVWKQYNDTLFISSVQNTSTQTTPFFNVMLPFYLETSNGDTIIYLYQNQVVEEFSVPFTTSINALTLNKDNWLLLTVNSLTQGIKSDVNNFGFALYPNPAEDILNLQFEANEYRNIKIFDISGRLLQKSEGSFTYKEIDIRNLFSGVYIIKISNRKGENAIKKFIKY